MTMFGCAKKLSALALLPLLTLGNAWGGEFKDKVERIFSSSVVESISESGSSGEVTFRTPERMPDYFETGDKVNKVFAIESARVFRDVTSLERLTFRVPADGKRYTMSISRDDIEQHYGVDFAEMNGDLDAWRTEFTQDYDNKQSRAEFVEKFVAKE